MATAFEAAGQQHSRPVKYAPLFTDRYFTGLWTNRNPMRDAATSFVLSRYGNFSRFESLIDGQNVELTSRLTLARRPGLSSYNNQAFGKILNFYSYKRSTLDTESIQVLVHDATAATIYNATGPSTKNFITYADPSGFPTAFLTLNNPNLGSVVAFQQNYQGISGSDDYLDPVVYDGTNVYPWGIYISGLFQPAYTNPPYGLLITYTKSTGQLSPTVGYEWAFSYYNSKTGDVSNVVGLGSTYGETPQPTNVEFNLTGPYGATLPPVVTFQADKIILWRTLDGGSTYFYLTTLPNPYTGTPVAPWTYTDNTPDNKLNEFQQAAVALENTSLATYLVTSPANPYLNTRRITASAFHLGCAWLAIGNVVYYSNSGSAILGTPTSGFPPLNNFTYPSSVKSLIPTAIGLLVITTEDIYIIQGTTTVLGVGGTPVFSTPFLAGYGTTSAVAVCQDGSTLYMITSDNQVLSLDPNAGVSEVGFPVGDILNTYYPASQSYVTFLRAGSIDKALYVTNPDLGTTLRMSPTSAPETGLNWSPQASWTFGCSAVQALETSPGQHQLLFGPGTAGNIIRFRDQSVRADQGVAYRAFFTIGSTTLANPGQLAEISFIAADLVKADKHPTNVPNIPTVSVLFDEVFATADVPFTALNNPVVDPPELSSSVTLTSLRWYVSSALGVVPVTGQPLPAWCRHMQLMVDFGAADSRDEIYTHTIYGAVWNLG